MTSLSRVLGGCWLVALAMLAVPYLHAGDEDKDVARAGHTFTELAVARTLTDETPPLSKEQKRFLEFVEREEAQKTGLLSPSWGYLYQLTPAIGRLTHLHTLFLGRRCLRTLPAELAALQSLQHLNLTGNDFSVFPSVILQLPELFILDVSWNLLGKIPCEISRLRKLGALMLRGNVLRVLPPEIAQLPALRLLDVATNPLLFLPPWRPCAEGEIPPKLILDSGTDLLAIPESWGPAGYHDDDQEHTIFRRCNPALTGTHRPHVRVLDCHAEYLHDFFPAAGDTPEVRCRLSSRFKWKALLKARHLQTKRIVNMCPTRPADAERRAGDGADEETASEEAVETPAQHVFYLAELLEQIMSFLPDRDIASLTCVNRFCAKTAIRFLERRKGARSLVFPNAFMHVGKRIWKQDRPRLPLQVVGLNRPVCEEFPAVLELIYGPDSQVPHDPLGDWSAAKMLVRCHRVPLFSIHPFAVQGSVPFNDVSVKRCMALYAAMVMREDPEWDGFLEALIERCRQLGWEAVSQHGAVAEAGTTATA